MANVRHKTVKTFGQLRQSIAPMLPGEPERIPWTWFDTVSYVSGTSTQLDFFQTVQTDRVLGNMQAAGQIPAPMYFDLHHLGIYFDLHVSHFTDAAPAAQPAVGALNDLVNLVEGAVSLQIAQKEYWSGKVGMCPGGYGPHGQLSIGGSDVAATSSNYIQQGTNGVPDLRNRNNFWGDITLPHNQNFLVRLNWTAAITLQEGNTPIVVVMDGYLYRRVL